MIEINLDPFPVLETERLLLRQIVYDDVEEIYFLRTDDEVMRYIEIPRLISKEATFAHIDRLDGFRKNNEGITWAITLKNNPKLIGTILFKSIDKGHHRAEVGYMLHFDYWRKGIVQEALTAVLNYGFNTLQFHSIEAFVNPDNEASIGVLKKNNFVREAYYKENYYFEGKFLDTAVYSLLKSNFNHPQPPPKLGGGKVGGIIPSS